MQLNTKIREVSSGGLSNRRSRAKMTINAKAIRIFSDGIYSQKKLAILREVGCNALDAHIAAGVPDRPISVHLPTQFEPWLAIQDFGIGLSDEQIMGEDGIYMDYFNSTKTDSNDMVGAFGLGSKSPFCYTDAFTVTSVHGGFRRQYSIVIAEDGMPDVIPMGEPEETTDHNGLTVMVPVGENDIHAFRSDALKAYQFFDVLPDFNINITIPRPMKDSSKKLMMETENWRLTYNDEETRYVTQGPVGYPLAGILPHVPLNTPLRSLLESNLGIVLRMPMGSMDITASREEVSWDERTIANVLGELNKIYTDMETEASRTIAEAQNWPEACYLSRGFYDQFGEKLYRNLISSSVTFAGEPVTDSVELHYIDEADAILRASYLAKETQKDFYFTLRDEERDRELFINMNRPLKLVWNNEDKEWKGLRRLKLHLEETGAAPKDFHIVMLSCSREMAVRYVNDYFHISEDQFDTFVECTTDFPAIVNAPKMKGPRKVRDTSKPKYPVAVGMDDHATIAAVEDCIGYVVTNRGTIIEPGSFYGNRGLDTVLAKMNDVGWGDFTGRVARVRKGYVERFKKDFPNVPLLDVGFKDIFEAMMKASEMDRNIYAHRNELVNDTSAVIQALPKLIEENKELEGSIEANYVAIVQSMKDAAVQMNDQIWRRADQLRSIASKVGFYSDISTLGSVYNADEIDTIRKRYPLAQVAISSYLEDAEREELVTEVRDYIFMKMKGIYNLI